MRRMKLFKDNNFTEQFENFQTYNKGKNLSESTINYYHVCKNSIISFMGNDFDVSTFNEDKLEKYKQYLKDNGNNSISINTRLRGLRAIFNFFAKHEYAPQLNVTLPKTEKTIKETYTDAELKILLVKPNIKKVGFDEYRNWCIVSYLLATGNRLSTIINIKTGDLNIEQSEIILRHTKNKKQQIIPVTTSLKTILIEYLRYRKPKNEDDYLFCNAYGGQLTASGLANAISRYNTRRGVLKTSIHLFRHTFARLFIKNGGDILRLQRLLGHSCIQQTMDYVNLFGRDLAKDYDKINPLEQFKQREFIKLK